jgi:eukaryotic-like serine/threonine-protein kinase
MRPTSGLTFGGRYQLSNRIAIGGMGEVWQATDAIIGRTVAIKILKDEYLGDPGFLERFRAEARHAALVNHEGIANVFDYGEEDGSAFLVMELVPGEALSSILERERVLSTDRVLDIVAQTSSALHAAHAAGLVHRDIKPGNLLITPEGRVKITDFGIARIADQVPLTATGQVMGTVQYLSPEQASGHPASPSTDIYSLGIVAYEALAGRRPFTGESQVAIAMAQINETPPDLPASVAEPVRNLVMSCIAKRPEDRPGSAAHLGRAAQALRRGDVAGAAAAVPAVAGFGAFTQPIATGAGMTGATRVLTTAMPGAGEPTDTAVTETEERKRSPWTWPLIALIALLALLIIGGIIALVANPGGQAPATNSSTRPSQTQSETPSAEPEPTDEAIVVTEDAFLGMPEDEFIAAIEGLGLVPVVAEGDPAPTAEDEGRVYNVDPTGNLEPGTEVTGTVYGPMVVGTPPPPQAVAAPDTAMEGERVRITWPQYDRCPEDFPLTGYTFSFENASEPSRSNPVNPGAVSMDITVGTEGETTISYVANCSQLPSDSSDATTITVEAPEPEPEPEPEPDPGGEEPPVDEPAG